MKHLSRTLAALCVFALIAASCGSGSSPESSSEATASGDGNGTEESKSEPSGEDKDILIGLVTKTNDNPFFVKMRDGAEAKAEELGVELQSFAGAGDGDNESQVEAIENLISAGADGILITPSDPVAIAPTLQKAQDEGILVIALDTPTDPADAVSQTFATDNFKAGELVGEWAKETMGADAESAKIALLDLNPNQVTVDVARNQGFLSGFGIDLNDENVIGDETDERIVGNDVTDGNEEGGRTAMENLLRLDPEIDLVYTINEPAAAGAVEALKAVGREDDVLVVSVDGGCPGVQNIADGVIDATAMQFPLDMASLGVEAVVEFSESGEVPGNSDGLEFFNTGVELVTDSPVDGLDSIDTAEGLELCWG